PGLAIEGGIEQYALEFEQAETIYPHRTRDKLVLDTPEKEALMVNRRTLALNDELFAGGAFVCKNLSSRKVWLRREVMAGSDESSVEVGWDGFSIPGVWKKPGASYLCIEPW